MFFLSHRSVTVSYSVFISILLLFLLPSNELPVRIKMNKQESSSKLFSQFSPTPVRSVVLLMFSKRCHYFARLTPLSLCWVTIGHTTQSPKGRTLPEPVLFRNSAYKEIDCSVTVSKVSGPVFMVKSICLHM